MAKTLFILFFCLLINIVNYAQNTTHGILFKTGYNRIGFYNNLSYQFNYKQHQITIGPKHYTLDNFFEKNTIGLFLGYGYIIEAKNKKTFFKPSIEASFFKENKSSGYLNLKDFQLSNKIGYYITQNINIGYTLGFGVILANSKNNNGFYKAEYYNYEMALSVGYHFVGNK